MTSRALCDCANSEKTSPELKGIQLQFFDALKQMVEGGRYDTREDFTVVLQPHLVDQDFPKDVCPVYLFVHVSAKDRQVRP